MNDATVRGLLRAALEGDEDAGAALALAHQRGATIRSTDLARAAVRSRCPFALAWANALFGYDTGWERVTRNVLERVVQIEVLETNAARRAVALKRAALPQLADDFAALRCYHGKRKRQALRRLGVGAFDA